MPRVSGSPVEASRRIDHVLPPSVETSAGCEEGSPSSAGVTAVWLMAIGLLAGAIPVGLIENSIEAISRDWVGSSSPNW